MISEDLMDSTVKSLDITFNVLDNVLDMAAENVSRSYMACTYIHTHIYVYIGNLLELATDVNLFKMHALLALE